MARVAEPDRGWAWMIVLAVTVINLSILPVQQCFGLIFKERFSALGISATQTSLILHLNGTITCSLGLISGPMMKRFSFRKVAYLGGLTVALGVFATAFAVSVPWIVVTYCVLVGIGQGIMFPATSLAMNTYFRKKRNMAMGFSVSLTGLGPIVMPLLIVVLLSFYGTTGTLIVLAGIAMHACIGASLLRPFAGKKIGSAAKLKDDHCDQTPAAKTGGIESESAGRNGGVECRLLDEEAPVKVKGAQNVADDAEKRVSFLGKVAENLDLELLKDSRYIAVVLGMSISMVAETNFNALFPFVLAELSGLEMTAIAQVMSTQAAFDIAGRLCVPLLAQKCHWTPRNLYVISLLGATLGRTLLSTWGSTYAMVIAVAVIAGVSKGTKAVFQALIIPDYVPLERLPAASGIQMVCNGILSIGVGPIIGLVRDATKSYVGALHFTSLLSFSCVVLWLIGGLWFTKRPAIGKRAPGTGDADVES